MRAYFRADFGAQFVKLRGNRRFAPRTRRLHVARVGGGRLLVAFFRAGSIDRETSSLRLRGFATDIRAALDEPLLVVRADFSFLDERKGLWSCWITLSTPLDAD